MNDIIQRDSFWFMNAVREREQTRRIADVLTVREYLLRRHPVLTRKDTEFKGETFVTAKIVLNSIKSIIDAHVSYCIGNPVSVSGKPEITNSFSRIYKRGGYNKIDYEIATDIIKYGNAFEYVYLDDTGNIKSKVIENTDAFPIYDEMYNYIAFIEHWRDMDKGGTEHYIVYYPDCVEEYTNSTLKDKHINLTGLPIHYSALDKSADSQFGEGIVLDLLPIMNAIEYLLSCMDDAVVRLSLSPIGVARGQRIDSAIPQDIVGVVMNLQDTDSGFEWAASQLDHNSIKLLLDNLIQQFYATACVPAALFGQSNISNVSEVSLKLLFTQTDNKAKKTIQSLEEGIYQRFNYFRKLLKHKNINITDDDYDTLNVTFNINRPIDTNSQMEDLKMQREMGAISKQTIIEKSPYTTDFELEINRLQDEKKPTSIN